MAKRPSIRILSARIIPDHLKRFDHDAILYVYQVDGHTVRAIHWSGRYDGPAKWLARHLRRIARKHRADYITTTESQQKGARKAVRRAFGKGWGVRKTGEYLCVFRRATFRPIRAPHVSIFTAIRNYAQWRQMHVGTFNLRHRTLKRRWRILAIHGPSAIQAGSSFRRGKQSEIAWQGWPKVGRKLRRFHRKRPRAVQVVAADCNANLRDTFWMAWFEAQTGATCIWRNQTPNRGTHAGGRLIDAAWIKGAKPAKENR